MDQRPIYNSRKILVVHIEITFTEERSVTSAIIESFRYSGSWKFTSLPPGWGNAMHRIRTRPSWRRIARSCWWTASPRRRSSPRRYSRRVLEIMSLPRRVISNIISSIHMLGWHNECNSSPKAKVHSFRHRFQIHKKNASSNKASS